MTTPIDEFRQEDSPVAQALVSAYDHAREQHTFWSMKPGRVATRARLRWWGAQMTLKDLARAILLRRQARKGDKR